MPRNNKQNLSVQSDLALGQPNMISTSTQDAPTSDKPTKRISNITHSKPITYTGLETNTDLISVTKSNRLIEGQNLLNSRQQRLLWACIGLIDPTGNYPNGITVQMDIHLISILTQTKVHHVRSFIEEAATAFHKVIVNTPGKQPDTFDIINIAHRSIYDPKNQTFTITFHQDMEAELINLARYTRISLNRLVSLRGKYAGRIYELISMWYNKTSHNTTQHRRVAIANLMFPLGLVDIRGEPITASYTLERVGVIKREIIEPSIREINKKTEFFVKANYHKVGKSISAITFTITIQNVSFKEEDSKLIPIDDYELGNIDIIDLLGSLKLNSITIDTVTKTYDPQYIARNIRFIKERISSGSKIENITAYLNHCLQYNLAEIPEVANPYSPIYKSDKTMQDFVAFAFTRSWFKMSQQLQDNIKEFGIINNMIIEKEYFAFKGIVQNKDQSTAESILPINELIKIWENKLLQG